MNLLLLMISCCIAVKDSHQQYQKKQFVNLGESFNFQGNDFQGSELQGDDGSEDGFSRALNDASLGGALGGELGNEDSGNQQMHISENNQGGINLGQNSDELGSLASLLGGNSVSPFQSTNSFSSLGGSDDFGLGGEGKENQLLETLGGSKSLLGGNDQLAGLGGGDQSEKSTETSNLLDAFGLNGNNGDKGSDGSLDSLLGGNKEQSLMSLLNLGDETGKAKSQADTAMDGLNLDDANSNSNVENTANLGDSINTGGNTDLLGLNKNDLATLLGSAGGDIQSSKNGATLASALKGEKQNDEGSVGLLQNLINGQGAASTGGDRQGIGEFGEGGGLTNELSQLDTTDDKLEKMLEGLGKVDTGAAQQSNYGDTSDADAQPSQASDEMPAMGYHGLHGGGMQSLPSLLGGQDGGNFDGLSGMMGMGGLLQGMGGAGGPQMNGMHIQPGQTVHAHASDKPGSSAPVSPAEASKPAKQAQRIQEEKHKIKLMNLRHRLKILREKLEELTEEQSKKSHSVDSPAGKRKEAIKKLLIKNLKLAALIASKEIQLEEAKESAFTGKKETDDLGLIDLPTNLKETPKEPENIAAYSNTKAKPLTDLSKKAEEEVNHLIKAQENNKTRRDKSTSIVQDKKDKTIHNKQQQQPLSNATIIKQINATLAKLSATSPKNVTVTPKAYKKLVQRITQLSPKKSAAVQEAALSSLYKALTKTKPTKASGNAKKLAIKYVNIGCYKDGAKRVLSTLESSFKSPLDKNYKTRLNALYKCARIAKLKGFPGFALENGGQCFGDKNILSKYKSIGASNTCNRSGKGGPWSLNVYKFV